MKVSEIPYQRYTIEQGGEAFEKFKRGFTAATVADEALRAHDGWVAALIEYETAASLANCRFTLDVRDEFYKREMAYYDEVGPLFEKLMTEYAKLMLASPLRPVLLKMLNPRLFRLFELQVRSFDENVTEDCQEENRLVTEYSGFMSAMMLDYDGQKLPLSVVRGKLSDADRTVRRRAAEAIGKGMEQNSETLDSLFDRLVKVRDRIAKKLGFRNFTELGYCRMSRMDYNADMVADFRRNVEKDLVPRVAALKEQIAAKLGIDRMMYYDDSVYQTGDTIRPVTDAAGIFVEAKKMYREMDPEIGDFMDSMLEAAAFDVEAREGKWGGGYCTTFAKYKQPFILANFNGGTDDIDVITHEFGHALAAHFVFQAGDPELQVGGMETAECHSMSMEFLCWRYTERFFGKNADSYRYKHLLSALSFIPYGVIVDEFQHIVYENPGMTPQERNEVYLSLEKKYRPWLSFEGIPYLEKGTRWQYQMHIYESPFYYIDYCLAQTVALGFLILSREDYGKALHSYLNFVGQGGTRAFDYLVKEAGIASPFDSGALAKTAERCMEIAGEIAAKL